MESLLENVVRNFEYCRKIIIPIHNAGHWHLMEVNFEDKEIRDYNSLRKYMKDQEVARWVRLVLLSFQYVTVLIICYSSFSFDVTLTIMKNELNFLQLLCYIN